MLRNTLKILCLGLFSIVLFACVAPPGSESTGEFIDSSTTTTKVKATLINDLGSTGISIQVKTFKDKVQLSGFVATERLKQRAGAIAANVDGVNSVKNDIIVRP